jgi:hypothetical protein
MSAVEHHKIPNNSEDDNRVSGGLRTNFTGAKAFDPFFTTKTGKGTGLGLSQASGSGSRRSLVAQLHIVIA